MLWEQEERLGRHEWAHYSRHPLTKALVTLDREIWVGEKKRCGNQAKLSDWRECLSKPRRRVSGCRLGK